jgi:biopolymer transport protein ExbB
MTVAEFFDQGGPVVVIILVGSILALTVFLERMYYLRNSYQLPTDTLKRLQALDAASIKDLEQVIRATPRPLHGVLARLLEWKGMSLEQIRDHIEPHMDQVKDQLTRGEDILSTIASLSPLLGLLGTVLGMTQVFQSISHQGLGDPTRLAGGISEALLTTIAGLVVAIPTFVGYKLVKAKVNYLMRRMEEAINKVFDALYLQR